MIKDDKGLPGIRGPKSGQNMMKSMEEQIFELQEENQVLKEKIQNYVKRREK